MRQTWKVKTVVSAWAEFCDALGFDPLQFTDSNGASMARLLSKLLEATADPDAEGEAHAFLESVTSWMDVFDRIHVEIRTADPVDLLRHLMIENGLKQRDLADELGGQSTVSAVLNRKRSVNARQAKALGRRFGLSPVAFLGSTDGAVEDDVRVSVTSIESAQAESAISGAIPRLIFGNKESISPTGINSVLTTDTSWVN